MGLDMYLSAHRYVSGYSWGDEEGKNRALCDQIRELAGLDTLADPETPSVTVQTTVAYWRKANQIHQWFVINVQGGEDDCKEYWVSRDKLAELVDTCEKVLASCQLVPDMVTNGYTIGPDLEKQPILEVGEVVIDPAVAEELLPSAEGFFFGSTDYDQWYVEDLKSTISQLRRVLDNPASENVDFYYQSSW